MHLETNAGRPWLKSDLLFLKHSLEHGGSLTEVAAFLRRREGEVGEKAGELGANLPAPLPSWRPIVSRTFGRADNGETLENRPICHCGG
jgi:hypothetical protein